MRRTMFVFALVCLLATIAAPSLVTAQTEQPTADVTALEAPGPVIPLGPDPIPQIPDKPVYTIQDGRLHGPGVFYASTSWKTYRRPGWCGGRPLVGVLHYTAVLADTRPLTDLEKLLKRASIEYEALEDLRDTVGRYGLIPDCLALTLQNAGRQRKASWCLCIGREEIPGEGLTYVTQYNPDLRYVGTMHAGPGKLWKWRKKYRGREILTQDGDVRWDGRKARAPVVSCGTRAGRSCPG